MGTDITMEAVIFALVAMIARTAADIEEYTHEAAARTYINPKLAAVAPAKLINPNIQQQFCRLSLTPPTFQSLPLRAASSAIGETGLDDLSVCGPWLGINVDNGREYICNITAFRVATMEFIEGVMYFYLDFKSDTATSSPATLIIPTFKMPPSVASLSPKEKSEWAKRERVGLLSPLNEDQLAQLEESEQIKLDFSWLAELLNYGIPRRKTKVRMLRPLVLSGDLIEMLMDTVDWFQYEDLSGDYSISLWRTSELNMQAMG